MNQPEPKEEGIRQAGDEPSVKKPYHKPEVRYERVFETMALSCGKVQSRQAGCHNNRRAS